MFLLETDYIHNENLMSPFKRGNRKCSEINLEISLEIPLLARKVLVHLTSHRVQVLLSIDFYFTTFHS